MSASVPSPASSSESRATRVAAAFEAAFGRAPTAVAFAPGRIEFIGNHTDYNGGPVMGVAVDRGVTVAVAPRTDGVIRLRSAHAGAPEVVVRPAAGLVRQEGASAWANYPLGVLAALPKFDLPAPGGCDYLADSDLPAGAGLSSSAAIELASAVAFLRLAGADCPRPTLAQVGRHAENRFVGVPCGILDQGVSAFGRADHAVLIDCAALTFEALPLVPGLGFRVFNTHTKHALVDGLYAARHRECQSAAAALGVAALALLTPEEFKSRADPLDPLLRRRAEHVVGETARVRAAERLMRTGRGGEVGPLLLASHHSSRYLFENSTPELDFLVDSLAVQPGVLGARLTGGGFGGAVMALTSPAFAETAAAEIASAYAARFGDAVDVLTLRAGDGATVLVG